MHSRTETAYSLLLRSIVMKLPLRSLLPLMICASLPVWSQPGSTPTTSIPTTYVGVGLNSNNHHYPPSGTDFGVLRFWDTPGASWPAMQASAGAQLTTTAIDNVLADAYANSVNHQAVAMYTFGQIPAWASGSQDVTCAYGPGTCDPPSDIAADGTGSDAYFRAFVTALAKHVNGLSSTQYARVVYFEPWNEIDRSNTITHQQATSNVSYNGTFAQLLRMTEDMRCILTGNSSLVIHNINSVGSSTQCSSSAWSQWGSQQVGIISNAVIVSPSSHAQGGGATTSLGVVQNFLYCNDSNLPQPDCNWGAGANWGSKAVDIINFHMKPGNEAPSGAGTDPETEMQTETANVAGILNSTDKAKPLWDGEAGYSGNGWSPNGGDVSLAKKPVQQAAFVSRYMFVNWSLGIQNFDWYLWDLSNFLESGGVTTDAGVAYSTVASWMIGATMTSSCGLVNGNGGSTGSLWSCKLQNGTWTGEVFWDTDSTNYNCDSGTCNTYSYNVPPASPNWHFYQTPIGSLTSISSPFTIQVSNLPVIIMTNRVP